MGGGHHNQPGQDHHLVAARYAYYGLGEAYHAPPFLSGRDFGVL